jgi:hypothetical protein
VHKKYTWKNGKRFGPYYYENKRVNGKVVSKYLGSVEYHSKLNSKRKGLKVLGVMVLVVLLLFLLIFQGVFLGTGRVALDLDTSYNIGDNLSGKLRFNLKEGELIPLDSKVIVNLGGEIKEFSLVDLVETEIDNGDYYAEGVELIGSGEGFGIIGGDVSYPDVNFELSVFSVGGVDGGGSDSDDEEVVEDVDVVEEGDVNDEDSDDEEVVEDVDEEDSVEVVVDETDDVVDEVVEESEGSDSEDSSDSGSGSDSSDGEDSSDSSSSPSGDSGSESSGDSDVGDSGGDSEDRSDSGGDSGSDSGDGDSGGSDGSGESAITGEAVRENEFVVKGSTNKKSKFSYNLEDGQSAEIITGSVSVNGSSIDDEKIKLKVKKKDLEVTTKYSTGGGFGKEYLGDEKLNLEIDLSEFGFSVNESGVLSVQLVFEDIIITESTKNVIVNDLELNESVIEENISEKEIVIIVNESVVNVTLINVTEFNASDFVNVSTIQFSARLGEPVKWVKRVNSSKAVNLTIEIPSSAGNISVKKIDDGRLKVKEKIKDEEKIIGNESSLNNSIDEVLEFNETDVEVENNTEDVIIKDDESNILTNEVFVENKEADNEELLDDVELGDVIVDINGNVIFDRGDIEGKVKIGSLFEWLGRQLGITGFVIGNLNEDNVSIVDVQVIEVEVNESVGSVVEIEYYTDAPMVDFEEEFEKSKRVGITSPDDVHYEDVLIFTEVSENLSFTRPDRIRVYWEEGNVNLEIFNWSLNEEGFVSYVEWIAPELSNQTFSIIEITKADHLDENRTFVEDVFEYVKERDDNWTTIPEGHYLRVTFERNLTSKRDITIYAKSEISTEVEVYENNGTELIALFENVSEDKKYRIILDNSTGAGLGNKTQDIFDLLVKGGDVEFDYVVDPDVSIATDAHTVMYRRMNGNNQVWTNTSKGVFTYLDSGTDGSWLLTLNSGGTWTKQTDFESSSSDMMEIWYDKWTTGQTGDLAYVVHEDNTPNDVRIAILNTTNETMSNQVDIYLGETQDAGNHLLSTSSITKSRNGILYAASRIDNDGEYFFSQSYDNGQTWLARAEIIEGSGASCCQDRVRLVPGNETDPSDILAIYYDDSDLEITIKTYDNSSNSWSESAAIMSHTDGSSDYDFGASVRHRDNHTLFAAWDATGADNDLYFWDIGDGNTYTRKLNVINISDGTAGKWVNILINQQNDNIYVAYIRNSIVYYKLSEDGGDSWGSEIRLSEQTAVDSIHGAISIGDDGGRFMPIWYETTTDTLETSNATVEIEISPLVPPDVTISKPLNTTLDEAVVTFNITTSRNSTAVYSLDGGVNNVTMTANSSDTGFTATNTSIADGGYRVSYYVKDARRDDIRNFSESVDFGVSTVVPDTTAPNVTFQGDTPANASTQTHDSIVINFSTSDDSEHYAFVDFDDDLVLYLRMDSANSTTVLDESGYSTNGVMIGNTFINTSGRYGNTSHFDGAGDRIEIATLGTHLNQSNNLTFAFWMKNNAPATFRNPFSFGSSAFRFEVGNPTTNLHIYSAGITGTVTCTACLVADNVWKSIIFTSNSTSWELYIDGNLNESGATTGGLNVENSSTLYLGQRNTVLGAWSGSVDEVIILNRTITANEVAVLYNASANEYYRNFTGLSDADHTFDAYAVDLAGNLNDSETRSVTVDAAAPTVTINSPADGDLFRLELLPIVYNITLNENGSARISLDGGVNNLTLSGDQGGFHGIVLNGTNGSIVDGHYTLSIYANDSASNNNNSVSLKFSYDDTAPNVSFQGDTPANASVQTYNSIVINFSTRDQEDHYAFVDFDNEVLGWWRFDEMVNATEVRDISKYGNNGTFVSSIAINSSGRFGNATHNDGVNGYIRVPYNEIFNVGTGGFSVSAWIYRLPDERTNLRVFSLSGGNDDDGGFAFFGSDTSLSFIVGNTSVRKSSSATISVGEWTHVVGAVNDTKVMIFKNGVLADNDPRPDGQLNDSEPICIGDNQCGNSVEWNGSIDEVIFFNRSLSANEVAMLYNASANEYYRNFTGLSEATHTFDAYAVDMSGNLNDSESRTIDVDFGPFINYVAPTPASTDSHTDSSAEINFSMDDESLTTIVFNWNGTNFTLMDKDLVLFYNFDNRSELNEAYNGTNGSLIINVATGKNNATLFTGSDGDFVYNLTGKYGGAFEFSGARDYLAADGITAEIAGGDISIEAWFKTTLGSDTIVAINTNSGGNRLGVESDRVFDATNASDQFYNADTLDGEWHHVVVSHFDSANYNAVYIDGVLDINISLASTIADDDLFSIGQEWDAAVPSGFFNGPIDDVRIWNRSLYTNEVEQLYMSSLTKYNMSLWNLYTNRTLNATAGLSAGNYTFYGCVNDGFTGDCEVERSVNVTGVSEFVAPVVTLNFPLNGQLLSDEDLPINFNVSLNENGSVDYSLDGGVNNYTMGSTDEGSGFGLLFNHSNTSIGDGSYTFSVYAQDLSSNRNFTASDTFRFDGTAPNLTFQGDTPANGSTQGHNSIVINLSTRDQEDHYAFVDSDNSLVGWWRMDDTNNATEVRDLSGYGNNGTLINETKINNTGKFGNASHYDGIGDYIFVPYNGALNITEEITISAWIKRLEFDNYMGIVAKTNGASWDYDFYLGKPSNSEVVYFGNDVLDVASNTIINDSLWHHIVITRNATYNTTFYLDGVNDGEGHLPNSFADSGFDVWVGKEGPSSEFNGSIDDVLVFNRSLSANEVAMLYNASVNEYYRNFTGLSESAHTFDAFAVDIAGNLNDSESRTVTIDKFPEISYVGPTPLSTDADTNASIEINFSIVESGVDGIVFNWNGTNITLMDKDLVLFYNFDNRSDLGEDDTLVTDLSGKSNNGSVNNSVVNYTDCQYGNCYTFDGIGDSVFVGDPADGSLDFGDEANFTISAWIKQDITGVSNTFLRKADATDWAGYSFTVWGGLYAYISDGSTDYFLTGPTQLGTDWSHGVFQREGSTLRFYLNGVQDVVNISSFSGSIATASSLYIGKYAGSEVTFNGTIDDVMIWNRSLSKAEVEQLYMTSLSKYNMTLWNLYTNRTLNATAVLSGGNYTFYGCATDTSGNVDCTAERAVNITSIPVADNVAPTAPTPIINTTLGTNLTSEGVYCNDLLVDSDGDGMNVSVWWWNESVLHLYEDYNDTTANASAFAALLDSANTTKGQNWTCGIKLYDGQTFADQVNSSSLELLNSDPVLNLSAPGNSTSTTDRTPNFTWVSSDADGDTLYYEMNITLNANSACSEAERHIVGISGTSHEIASELACFFDNGDSYNWSVRVNDSEVYSGWIGPYIVNISSEIIITLINNSVDFGDISLSGTNDTVDNSPLPFLIQNDGNAFVNITIQGTNLWSGTANPTSSYQYAIANYSYENASYSELLSIISFTNMPASGSPTLAIALLNYTNTTDTAEIDINVSVPADEISGVKSSTVTFTSSLT